MKKVLIISHPFPPLLAIGAQRPYRLAKYLPKHGWEPIVLTIKRSGDFPSGIKVIETDYTDITKIAKSWFRINSQKGVHDKNGIELSGNYNYTSWKSKLIKFSKDIITFPDDRNGWFFTAYKAASEFLRKEKVDAIISTSYPVTSHLIAKRLKRTFGVPWIADIRDIWTQSPYYTKSKMIKYFEIKLEVNTLAVSDAIVTVTEPWIDTLNKLHKNKRIFCVTNGFDCEEFQQVPAKLTHKFTISYTGILYNGKRDPSILFKVLSNLIEENKIIKDLVELRFYGPIEEWVREESINHNLSDIVKFHGVIPREDVIKVQRNSQLLLLLLWDNKGEEGFCPGKLYEYFGAKRPILAIGGQRSVVKNLLETTNAGKYVSDTSTLREILLEYYCEFIKFGNLKCCSNNNISNYSYNSKAKQYSEILNGLL